MGGCSREKVQKHIILSLESKIANISATDSEPQLREQWNAAVIALEEEERLLSKMCNWALHADTLTS